MSQMGQQPTSGRSSRIGVSQISWSPTRKRGQALQPGHGMVDRFTTAQSTCLMWRWGPPAFVALAAMAALTALTADAAARQARSAPTETTAPREAGEPIMAIVSIETQQVTF